MCLQSIRLGLILFQTREGVKYAIYSRRKTSHVDYNSKHDHISCFNSVGVPCVHKHRRTHQVGQRMKNSVWATSSIAANSSTIGIEEGGGEEVEKKREISSISIQTTSVRFK